MIYFYGEEGEKSNGGGRGPAAIQCEDPDKYAKGMPTVFAVEDRVTGHNPLAPRYTSRSYSQRPAGMMGPVFNKLL